MLDEQSRRERYRPLDCRDLVAGGVVHRVISAAGRLGQAHGLFARRASRLQSPWGEKLRKPAKISKLSEKVRQALLSTIRLVSFCRPTSPDLETVAARCSGTVARRQTRSAGPAERHNVGRALHAPATRSRSIIRVSHSHPEGRGPGCGRVSLMVAEGQQQELERANLEEIVTQIEAEPVPAVESFGRAG